MWSSAFPSPSSFLSYIRARICALLRKPEDAINKNSDALARRTLTPPPTAHPSPQKPTPTLRCFFNFDHVPDLEIPRRQGRRTSSSTIDSTRPPWWDSILRVAFSCDAMYQLSIDAFRGGSCPESRFDFPARTKEITDPDHLYSDRKYTQPRVHQICSFGSHRLGK